MGAAWATCSPDFGERGAVDRLGQVKPKVLFVGDRYYYRGKRFHLAPKVDAIAASLRTTTRTIILDYPAERRELVGHRPSHAGADPSPGPLPAMPGSIRLADYLQLHSLSGQEAPSLEYRRGGFDLPVYIMFSSGTTGKPKCMVQGYGE